MEFGEETADLLGRLNELKILISAQKKSPARIWIFGTIQSVADMGKKQKRARNFSIF